MINLIRLCGVTLSRARFRRWRIASITLSLVLLLGGVSESRPQHAPARAPVALLGVDDWASWNLARARSAAGQADHIDPTEGRATSEQIRRFLRARRSPMADHSDHIVAAARQSGVDPKLIVAIAGVESSFGRKCSGHNAWGWNNGRTSWNSWEEAINSYVGLFATSYPNWRNIPKIAPRYNPNTPDAWGRKVAFLIREVGRA